MSLRSTGCERCGAIGVQLNYVWPDPIDAPDAAPYLNSCRRCDPQISAWSRRSGQMYRVVAAYANGPQWHCLLRCGHVRVAYTGSVEPPNELGCCR